jgi:hypothetical protein
MFVLSFIRMKITTAISDYRAFHIMAMVMVVSINSQRFRFAPAEQSKVSGVCANVFWLAMTTNVLIKANHFVSTGHHQMEIVRNHQNATVVFRADSVYDFIKFNLAIHIDTLRRLVKDKQLRFAA